ncbi:ABC transporter ATP-binding protein [Methyloglobulus morosus]|nr:ABC transporter ATP-binding protein [Methyloglobulus morosus]
MAERAWLSATGGVTMPAPVIHCEGLGKRFRLYGKPSDRLLESILHTIGGRLAGNRANLGRDYWALRNISFTVSPGETVAIIGLNGSGKSTLLQLIAGILSPSEGVVRVKGRVAALLELGAGFHPEFSGLENIRISASVLGLKPKEIDQRLEAILAFADIGDFIDQPIKTYSSGMYVRLAFAISIHADPDILIVDEALSVGDMAFQSKCMARIRRFQQEGKALLFVSHDVGTVRALCDRAIYLDHGALIDIGATGSVVDHYLRDIHQKVDSGNQAVFVSDRTPSPQLLPTDKANDLSRRYADFLKSVQGMQYGSGQACIRLVELVDTDDLPLEIAEFDAVAKIRIWVECLASCTVSINYKIRDRNLIPVAGADFLITGQDLLEMSPGDSYWVEYSTRLPLMDGTYSIRVSVTIPIARHEQAVFVDVVEVCCPFKILPSHLGKIYTCAYLSNEVAIKAVE